MNWVDYRERLGIGFDDNEKLLMCINRIKNITTEVGRYYDNDALLTYMNTVGENYELYWNNYEHNPYRYALANVCNSVTVREFVSKYVALINSAQELCVADDGEKFISKLLEAAIVGTLEKYRILFEIIRDKDGVFIFPKGIPEFDKDLVSDSFLWLNQYPETEKAWGNALRAYSAGEEPSDVADKFRKTLERFFQNFFQSDSTLENLKSNYGRYLKERGISGEIANNLECLLQQYANFMNNHAKHHDRTNGVLLEYIMYQTGNIMRLLIKLSEEDENT